MSNFRTLFAVVVMVSISLSGCFYARDAGQGTVKKEGHILDAAEAFFVSLDRREYVSVWGLLSARSRLVIVEDVYSVSSKNGGSIKKEDIARDFNSNGLVFNKYWEALRNNFDPDIVLNSRVWEFEEVSSDKATILLKGRGVTELRMFREENFWKVGFVETFWARNPGRVVGLLRTFFIK